MKNYKRQTVTSTDRDHLKKISSRLYSLIQNYELQFPKNFAWSILLALYYIIVLLSLVFNKDSADSGAWKTNTKTIESINKFYEVIWYPSIAQRYLTPDFQLIIYLITGTWQVLTVLFFCVIVLIPNDFYLKSALRTIFFNKKIPWVFIFLGE